ncbi:ribonuclease kappa [Cloeon dipterum]|uniref:ribonuclease kappa n=1 Tax=Cloeon dipterum TaxID=197152 RepID=UPI0032201F5A
MKVCGPKCSLCGLIISVWGIIQLLLMGFFYYIKSIALSEDLSIDHHSVHTAEEFYMAADRSYSQNAYNCWIAACLYLFTLLFSGHQFYMNSRSSLSM